VSGRRGAGLAVRTFGFRVCFGPAFPAKGFGAGRACGDFDAAFTLTPKSIIMKTASVFISESPCKTALIITVLIIA
jgi:hypothetical protein